MDRREFIRAAGATAAAGEIVAKPTPVELHAGSSAGLPTCGDTRLPTCEEVLLYACRDNPDRHQVFAARADFARRFEAALHAARPDIRVIDEAEYDDLVRSGRAAASRVMTPRYTWDTYEVKKQPEGEPKETVVSAESKVAEVPHAVLPLNMYVRASGNKERVDQSVASILRDMVYHVSTMGRAHEDDPRKAVTAVFGPDIFFRREMFMFDVVGWCHVVHEFDKAKQ
jgi:hypothetical protein